MGNSVLKLIKALPTGKISIGDINTELGTSGERSLGQADGRALAGVPSGQISLSDYQGKTGADFIVNAGEFLQDSPPLSTTSYGYNDANYDPSLPTYGSIEGDYNGNKVYVCYDFSIFVNGDPFGPPITALIIENNFVNDIIGKTLSINNKNYTIIAGTNDPVPLGSVNTFTDPDGNTVITPSTQTGGEAVPGNDFGLANGVSYPVKIS